MDRVGLVGLLEFDGVFMKLFIFIVIVLLVVGLV